MSSQPATKDVRIELRVNTEQKALIEEAASLTGMSTSSYVLIHILESAKKEIHDAEKITLCSKDRDIFMKALEKAGKPNKSLKVSARWFKSLQ